MARWFLHLLGALAALLYLWATAQLILWLVWLTREQQRRRRR